MGLLENVSVIRDIRDIFPLKSYHKLNIVELVRSAFHKEVFNVYGVKVESIFKKWSKNKIMKQFIIALMNIMSCMMIEKFR